MAAITICSLMYQFSSVAQSCLTLWDPTDCSTPGLPVHHQLLEFTQTHVHWCHPTISSSVAPYSSCPQSFPASGSFPMSCLFVSGGQSTRTSALVPVLPLHIQSWFPLGWTTLISLQSKGLPKNLLHHCNSKNINFVVLSLLYGPTLTSIHDYWKNHGLKYMGLCQQSNVSSF